MTDQKDKINLGESFVLRQQSREKIVGLFGTNLFQIFNCVFVPSFCEFVKYPWLLLLN